MKIKTEEELRTYGKNFAKNLELPALIELIGDVGTGKTTLTRGIAEGLGIKTPVTSPSFTISKRYPFNFNDTPATLIHYDFYRLPDPGIMSEELSEALQDKNALIIIEWGNSIEDLLPENHLKINLTINPDGTRNLTLIP